jgi:hypothetical protein
MRQLPVSAIVLPMVAMSATAASDEITTHHTPVEDLRNFRRT